MKSCKRNLKWALFALVVADFAALGMHEALGADCLDSGTVNFKDDSYMCAFCLT